MALDNEYSLKIIMVGDCETGKSSLVKRIIDDRFTTKNKSVISHDTELKKNIKKGEKNIQLNFFDVNGKEKFQTIKKPFYNDCSVILVIFDLTSIESFRSIPFWIQYAKTNTNLNFIILVGTKADLTENRCIDDKTIINLCKNHEDYNIKYIETSSKTKKNVQELIDLIVNTASIYKTSKISACNETNKTYSTFENMSETIKLIPHKKTSRTREILQRIFSCFGSM